MAQNVLVAKLSRIRQAARNASKRIRQVGKCSQYKQIDRAPNITIDYPWPIFLSFIRISFLFVACGAYWILAFMAILCFLPILVALCKNFSNLLNALFFPFFVDFSSSFAVLRLAYPLV
uniref:Caveolin n=1 Tax=Steinernema glaseri TaxID=37863 RepID=A0A1I7Z0V2_9BILA